MVLKAKPWVLLLIGAFLLTCLVSGVEARKWGVGTFLSYNKPLLSLGEQFSPVKKYGVSGHLEVNPKLYMELEYHRSKFRNGKIQDIAFTWAVDGKDYLSPLASSNLSFDSMAMNLLIFYPKEPAFEAKSFAHYIEVGTGFYHYKGETRNLIYPGQTGIELPSGEKVLDTSQVLQPQIDQRTALALNAGYGVQAFVLDNLAVDIRGRYNIVFGDLRSHGDWGWENKTFPMHLIDIGAGLKFYFWQ